MNTTKIDLYIGELILRNVSCAQRHHIAVAIEQELTRLLTEQGLPPSLAQGGYVPHISVDNIPITADASADTISLQAAQDIYPRLSINSSQS